MISLTNTRVSYLPQVGGLRARSIYEKSKQINSRQRIFYVILLMYFDNQEMIK